MKTIINLIAVCVILVACQSNDQVIRPATTPEILNIDTSSICYGPFEFSSGTMVDDCTETYEITSDSFFIITDGHGNKVVAPGPLKFEAEQYVTFDKPTCIKDFLGNEYFFGDGRVVIFDESLCDNRAP